MRHRNKRSKLSVMTAHRKAMMRTMVMNLLKYQRIEMTLARAKEVRRVAEHVITMAKENSVASRRRVYAVIADRDLLRKLYLDIVPLFKDRTSGFTRIIHTGFRRGDGADMALLELTERKVIEKPSKAKKDKRQADQPEGEKTAKAARQEKAEHGRKDTKTAVAEKEHEEAKKDAPKAKALPKGKPGPEEEKRAEKARSEDKKVADQRGFMKNLRGIFRKRGDF